ncbi:class I SAM-dependent methyltransferase [Streptomyces sp. NPDC087425]|uniref:class I SAM-dependent methyltransferase n=1 Tax=Streptomyces sp. NPDC087425 TaxID=3365787 RepID=UPI00380DE7AD
MDAQFWDERYRSSDRLFSGEPNGVLVTETADLTPGRALDVGCGEGGDALWLARRGWRVTGADISATALERAVAAGADVADRTEWTRADLTLTPPPADAFDLVSVHYFPFPRTASLDGLVRAVAPGGTLLFVSHDLADLPPVLDGGIDPASFHQPADVAALLGDDWTVLVQERRPRTRPGPAGTPHTHDVVLRARRLR